jgi:hypothetical protein
VLFVRCAGWRGGGFCGRSLLSSLMDLPGGEGNHFFSNGQGQVQEVNQRWLQRRVFSSVPAGVKAQSGGAIRAVWQ